MKSFSIIVCVNDKLAIGDNNGLLYHIKGDMKNFQRMTTDNVVIMGRKTFESLPNQTPLKNRINIIVTRDTEYSVDASFDNVMIVHTIEDAIALCDALYDDKECFVIGGESIYNEFITRGLVDTMYVTSVNDDKEGNAHFPDILSDNDTWKLFYQSYTQRQRSDEMTYSFSIYKKIV